jgi:hypothetical protein
MEGIEEQTETEDRTEVKNKRWEGGGKVKVENMF